MPPRESPQTYNKLLSAVRVGDVVKGDAGGWWRIVEIFEHRRDRRGLWVDLNAVNVDTDLRGRIYGYGTETRTLRR